MVFTGTFEHAIDAKNRLAIPSEIRGLLRREANRESDEGIALYVTLGEGQVLCLYTRQEFEKRSTELDHSDRATEEVLSYEALYYSLARLVEMDKNGRVRLPDNLLTMTGLGGDVVLLGVKDHLEIRDRAAWHDYVQKTLTTSPQILMNPRRAMRRPAPQ